MTIPNEDRQLKCITSGRTLILEAQYWRMSSGQENYEPIQVTKDTLMYRWKHAPEPYTGKVYDPGKEPVYVPENADVLDEMTADHQRVVNNLWPFFLRNARNYLFVGDEDVDFTYAAFCSAVRQFNALPNKKMNEGDWLVEKEFGTHYSVRHIQDVLDAQKQG